MTLWSGVRRAILWDFRRGSWQYDVIVIAILVFLFLTPRDWFRDQPRIFGASDVVMLPSADGARVFWMDPELLAEPDPSVRQERAETLLRERTGRRLSVMRIEPVQSGDDLRGYMIFAQP